MRFLRTLGLILVLLLLLPFIAVQFFGGPIARQVVKSLNNSLQTEIVIEEYDLSLLRSFPKLSADLKGVRVAGSDGSELLAAEQLGCRLDLASLFGKIRISGFQVVNGKLQLFTDRDGNTNYQLTGYTSVGDDADGDAGAESVEFAIERALFSNVVVVYQDAQLKTDALFTIDDATFSGDFGNKEYVMEAEGELVVDYIDQDGTRYLDRQELEMVSEITINNELGGYGFSPLRIYAGDLDLEVTGFVTPTEDGLTTALKIASSSGNLEDILALVPPAYAGTLSELETSGSMLLSADVNGAWTNTSYPRIDGRLTFTDGSVGSPRINVGARDLNLEATFAYLDGPRGGVQTFEIERLSGNFRRQPFEMSLRMEDLNDPKIEFSADGSLPLATLPGFLGEGPVTDGDGLIRLEGVRLSGRYADMTAPRRMGRVAAAGRIIFENGELTVNEREVAFPSGVLTLSDNSLRVDDFRLQAENTDLTFSGNATNFIPVLFADSLNTQDAALQFTATLMADELDIDELLALSGPSEEEIEAAEATGTTDSLARKGIERRARITDLLDGRFDADIDEWNWDKMEGENFRGQLVFTPGKLDLRGNTDAMEGQFLLEGQAYFQGINRIEARIAANGVDAEQFFYQSNNFDQEVLVSDNIKGEMDSRMLVSIYFDENGEVDYDRLRVYAGLEIRDGELRDFEMLENFAFALKSGDLERVRFTKLANYFEIVDQTIYIPAMFIQSSAINLTLSGSHTFNQYLDYYIKVNAGQVIANKISRHDNKLDLLPARNGFFNLYYTVKGPLESYEVESNKRAVKNDFERSAYRRDRVKSELEQRFQTPIEVVAPIEEEDVAASIE